jgi:hypothetical protein
VNDILGSEEAGHKCVYHLDMLIFSRDRPSDSYIQFV